MKYCPLPGGQNWWGILPEEILEFLNPAPIAQPKNNEINSEIITFLNPAIAQPKSIEILKEILTFLNPAPIAQPKSIEIP